MRKTDHNEIILFSMPGTQNLSKKVANLLGVDCTSYTYTEFADGEVLISSDKTVRNRHVYVIVSTSLDVNKRIMELLIFIDSLKRASAKSINIIFTYYGYARQDRKSKGRQPITARLVANLVETAGATNITAVDLHNPSIQGFFNIPLDDLRAQYVLADELVKRNEKFTIVSPDHGGTVRARIVAELISNDVQIAIVDKRRTGTNKTEVLGLIGDVRGKNVVIVDDIIDTGGTILKAAETLKKNGANKIIVSASHGIFTRGFEAFESSQFVDEVIITDSINHDEDPKFKHEDGVAWSEKYNKLTIISLDRFIASVIKAMSSDSSLSAIYEEMKNTVIK